MSAVFVAPGTSVGRASDTRAIGAIATCGPARDLVGPAVRIVAVAAIRAGAVGGRLESTRVALYRPSGLAASGGSARRRAAFLARACAAGVGARDHRQEKESEAWSPHFPRSSTRCAIHSAHLRRAWPLAANSSNVRTLRRRLRPATTCLRRAREPRNASMGRHSRPDGQNGHRWEVVGRGNVPDLLQGKTLKVPSVSRTVPSVAARSSKPLGRTRGAAARGPILARPPARSRATHRPPGADRADAARHRGARPGQRKSSPLTMRCSPTHSSARRRSTPTRRSWSIGASRSSSTVRASPPPMASATWRCGTRRFCSRATWPKSSRRSRRSARPGSRALSSRPSSAPLTPIAMHRASAMHHGAAEVV